LALVITGINLIKLISIAIQARNQLELVIAKRVLKAIVDSIKTDAGVNKNIRIWRS
jgi:hypothetical protein